MQPATSPLEPVIMVLFGITGDLAQRKVLPALYRLFVDGHVHEQTMIVGTSRQAIAKSDIITALQAEGTTYDAQVLEQLAQHLEVLQLDPSRPEDYHLLRARLQQIEDTAGVCMHRLFYLSIPPQIYQSTVTMLGAAGLNSGCTHGTATSRLLVEKPFGYDLPSAEKLIEETGRHFKPEQIFRIDHYLAKETAQNILTFRERNPLFSGIWNNRHITRISITAAEQIGIEGRANFYENVGALRDLIQSHLMQLLSLTLMDIPETLTSQGVHAAKQRVLQSLAAVPADDIANRAVRGQYETYATEVDNMSSTTETYASVLLYSDDPQWQGVPLRLTTGKALKIKRTSITVDFGHKDEANRLQFRLQPDEGIVLTMQVKQPGLGTNVEPTTMSFSYQTAFTGRSPDAYERVLIEAIRGDHTLFATDQEVLESWRVLQPLIDAWTSNRDTLESYTNGSDGPDTTKLMVWRDDR